ncbi:MAG: hypothetical protein ACJ8G7_03680 [Rhizobacter sp.]
MMIRIACALALAAAAALAHADPTPDYTFTQTWEQGSFASGYFFGKDLNGDGFLTTSEVPVFSFRIVHADGSYETIGPGQPDSFAFRVSGGLLLGDDPTEFIHFHAVSPGTGSLALDVTSAGSVWDFTATPESGFTSYHRTTTDPLHLVPIPEPEVGTLMGVGLVVLAVLMRRRRRL